MKVRTWSLMLVACCLLAAGQARAQALDYTYREAEKLSTDEKLEGTKASLEQMKDTLRLALERLQLAREKQDILQVNCVNDKLSAIKGLLKISEQADVSLKEAVAKGDDELINHEYTKISIAGARVENFRVEVEACVGEASQYIGRTELALQIDDDIRESDPSEGDPNPVIPLDATGTDDPARLPVTPVQ